MNFKFLSTFVFFSVFLSSAYGGNMWYDFQNTYASDGNAEMKVYFDNASNGADADVNIMVQVIGQDANCIFYEETSAYSDGTYADFKIDLNNCVEGIDTNGEDFNFFVQMVDDANFSENFEAYVPSFSDIDLNIQDKILDIDDSNDLNINFVFYEQDGNSFDYNGQFKAFLFGPAGDYITDYDINAESTETIPIDDFNDAVGKYTLVIGGPESDENTTGYKTFTFNVLAFNLTAFVQNDIGDSKYTYGTGDDLQLVVQAQDLNGDIVTLSDIYYQFDTDDLVEYSGTIGKKTTIDLNAFSEGAHTILVTGTVGDNNQSIGTQFEIVDFSSEALLKKNDAAGTKERFSGVYAPGDAETTLFFGVKDFENDDYETFDDSDCNLLFDSLEYSQAGFKAKTEIDPSAVEYNSKENLCEVTFTAPALEGEYIFNIDMNEDFNASYGDNLDQEVKLNVQQYVLFLDPIDVESAVDEVSGDIDKKASKFEFFDENLGFVVSATDLETGVDDLNVSDVSTISIVYNGTEYPLEEGDYSYDSNTRLLNINKDAEELDGVTGGFEVKADFDTNAESNSVIAVKGAGKKKIFKINIGLEREAYFGPPYVTPDENMSLVITASNSASSALEYAKVSIVSIYNWDTSEDVNLAAITAYDEDGNAVSLSNLEGTTNTSGTTTLNLGSGFDTGAYEITVDVNDGENYDQAAGFILVDNFFSFGFPGDRQQNGSFLENAYLGRDENIDIAVFVFSGEGFGDSDFIDPNDYNIPSGDAKLFFETDDGSKRKEIKATIVDLDSNVGWTKGQIVDYGRMVRITPSETLVPGIYESSFQVDMNGSSATAHAMFVIQGFGVQVCNRNSLGNSTCGESMNGEGGGQTEGSPDTNSLFILNGNGNNVTLTISLIDEQDFQVVSGAESLTYYRYSVDGYDTNNLNAFSFSSNVWDNNSANDNNIYVEFPSELVLGDYELLFDFVDVDGIHTKYSRFITIKQFNFSVLPSSNWQYRESYYIEDWENGGIDTNILDTDEWWTDQLCGDGNTFVLGDIDYNTFYVPGMTGTSDINYPMLIDLDNSRIYVDSDWDCNFVGDLNLGAGDKNRIDALEDADGNAPMFTNATLASLKHILTPADLSTGEMRNNFLGEFDVGREIVMPLLITDIDGDPVEDVNVEVKKVTKIDFINKSMETLTSGYTVTTDNNSDVNGIVFVKMTVEETGEYQLVLTLTGSDGKREKLMPWDGPIFQVKKFSSDFGFVTESRYNEEYKIVDVNRVIDSDLNGVDDGIMFYGIYDENVGGDIDSNTDSNKRFYFIYDSTYTNRFVIDDDTNFGEWDMSYESYGMQRREIGANWPTCLGDLNADGDNQNGCRDSQAIMYGDANSYDVAVDLLENKNPSFESDGQWINYSGTSGFSTDENYIGLRSYMLVSDAIAGTDSPVRSYETNNVYTFSFCGKVTAAGDDNVINVGFYIEQMDGNIDANYGYDFNQETWVDFNSDDLNQRNAFVVNSSDWNCDFTYDLNVEDITQFGIKFTGGGNDMNYYIDNIQMDGNLTGRTLSFYNKTSYRLLPPEFDANTVGEQFVGTYMLWVNSSVPDVNHFMEVSLTDRMRNDLNVVDANVNATLIQRNSCVDEMGPMKMDLLGKYIANTRIGDSWIVNLGNLGNAIGDSNCLGYEVKVDITADVAGTVYKDSSWNRVYVRNNE